MDSRETEEEAVLSAPSTESCGCAAPPKRVCDVCHANAQVFLACSGACLVRHLDERHPEQGARTSPERARAFAAAVNAKFPDNWRRFAPHRERLMQLVEEAGVGGRLAVLGAGNGADLELGWLSERFDEVQLVDLDEPSLERAKARHALPRPDRVVLRGGVDLSGFLSELDAWGDDFPEPAQLGPAAVRAAGQLVAELGRFDVVLSTCVLSQLGLPFRRAWVASRAAWSRLTSALTAVHLATLAGMACRGAVLACDVQTSQRVPGLDRFAAQDGEGIQTFVEEQQASGALELSPDPQALVAWLRAPGLQALVAEPRVTLPWLWDLGDARQLVYGVTFRHP